MPLNIQANHIARMAITFIASSVAGSTTGNNVATSTINTTGANFLVASAGYLKGASAPVADAFGNTWSPLTLRSGGSLQNEILYYCFPPANKVGSGHAASITATGDYPCLAFAAFAGVNPAGSIQESGFASAAISAGAATAQPGNLTPVVDGSLIICGASVSGTSPSFDSGLNTVFGAQNGSTTNGSVINSVGGQCWGGGIGYLIQGTRTAINPTLSWVNGVAGEPVITMAIFQPLPAADNFPGLFAGMQQLTSGIVRSK